MIRCEAPWAALSGSTLRPQSAGRRLANRQRILFSDTYMIRPILHRSPHRRVSNAAPESMAACSHLAALSSVQAIRTRPDAGNNCARIAVWRPRALARLASLNLITGRAGDFASVAVRRPEMRHNGRLTTAWLRFEGFRAHFDARKPTRAAATRGALPLRVKV